jgi:RsiW-degrading membrane proteinase PrsW (M82 family)
MKAKVKLAIFFGVVITSVLLMVNFFLHLFANQPQQVVVTRGFHPGGRGHHGGFETLAVMRVPNHGGEFSWMGLTIFLIIGLAVVSLLMKWLSNKSKKTSMQRLIETPVTGSYTTVINRNAQVLDQWEKNLPTKKENQ